MRILFIKLRHIGDSLLLTPTIVATKKKYPEAEIWVLVRKTCDGILAGCPEIDRIITTANPDCNKRTWKDIIEDLRLIALLRTTRFDYVFELTDNDRARFFAISARTSNRCVNTHPSLRNFWRPFFNHIIKTESFARHRVVKDYDCPMKILALPKEPDKLSFSKEHTVPWREDIYGSGESFAIVHMHTRLKQKFWPEKNWELLIPKILDFVPKILISCGPEKSEIESATSLCQRIGPKVQTTAGTASWPQLAWLLLRARFFIGVDTAAMHLAAACQCPIVSLFGPTPVFEYHPWKSNFSIIRAQDYLDNNQLSKTNDKNIILSIQEEWIIQATRNILKDKSN